jgi:hypothetical protein
MTCHPTASEWSLARSVGCHARRSRGKRERREPLALPNLIIIGAMKCGTSSMHNYLDAHPEISMFRQKELNFFKLRSTLATGRGLVWPSFSCPPQQSEASRLGATAKFPKFLMFEHG